MRADCGFLLNIRHFYHTSTLAAHVDESCQHVRCVVNQPRPLDAFGTSCTDKFYLHFFYAGVHVDGRLFRVVQLGGFSGFLWFFGSHL